MRIFIATVLTLGFLCFAFAYFFALGLGQQDTYHLAEVWLEKLQNAEEVYKCRNGRYTDSALELNRAGLLHGALTKYERSGLIMQLHTQANDYWIRIRPKTWPLDLWDSFYADSAGVVRRSFGPWANAGSPPYVSRNLRQLIEQSGCSIEKLPCSACWKVF
jgi:hypothetical protein